MATPDGKIKVDAEVVLRMLIPAAKHSEAAHGKKIVLLLGLSGSGKTTAANVLLGKPMRLNDMGNVEVDGPPPDDGLEIGHGLDSETNVARVTLCPDPTREGEAVALVDTPGLRDTRSIEHMVVALGSIEMVVRRADEVKALLVVIPWDDIKKQMAPQLWALVEDLALLFLDPAEMARNAVFLVNHLTCRHEEAERIFWRRLRELRDVYYHKACKDLLSNPMSHERYATMVAFVNVMIEQTNKIVFFDPLDGGRSARRVFTLVNRIQRPSYVVAGRNKYRTAFDEVVRSAVNDGMLRVQGIQELLARCAEIRSKLQRLRETERDVVIYKAKIANLRAENENCRNLGLEALERFHQLQQGLEVLAEITSFHDLLSSVVRNFFADYREFSEQMSELRDDLHD